MAPAKSPGIKPAALRAAFKADLAACWQFARALHPGHQPYAFALYGVEGGAHFTPHVLTEESLTQVAGRYLKEGHHDTLDEARKALRYSVADSPRFAELEDKLPSVEALLKPHRKFLRDEETAGYKLIAGAAMSALKALDKENLFGKGKLRERLLLIIITEDTDEDWTKSSARQLNPPAVFKRFEADTRIVGHYARSAAMVISPDERSLYSTGSRETGRKEQEKTSEVVAYDIAGLRLKRRWAFLFPCFGDSGRAIACARDGKTVLVMRAQYEDEGCQALLMRFGRDKKTIIQKAQLPGEPVRFAVSNDDSRIAVSMQDLSLHVLDGKLSVLKVLPLPAKARHLKFLASGDLLASTEAGIFRIGPDLKPTATPFREKCLRVSVAEAKGLAVANLDYTVLCRTLEKEKAVGCKVLHLPSFKVIREIELPELVVELAVISPDGRYLAFDARKIKTYRNFTIVCETETGREIARRKSNGHTSGLTFLRDGTLVIAGGGFTTTEPITFWRVPGL